MYSITAALSLSYTGSYDRVKGETPVKKNHKYIDFLAKLAIDNAHPGGRRLTEGIINRASIKPGDSILDVGCGTGATSALLAEKIHADVTGIDFHPGMVKRAKKRSMESGLSFKVLQASAEELPFEDHTFDWVLSESVTAFTDSSRSVPEYLRVLRPGGKLIAVEMTLEKSLPLSDTEGIQNLYGVQRLYTENDWKAVLERAGFTSVKALKESDIVLHSNQSPLPVFHLTSEIDDETFEIWLTHLQVMQNYKDVLSYRIYLAAKPLDS
ncbi:class I SAM-dependent methyltransferase [Sporolactobacillus sp. THM7-4]|nr:class I SAM-dependent methyltransferase [Sporolactobacillus sp. THM7-4]